ncbi:hypothetical protein [Desulfocurvibacter africanus]|uniref:hypothetical protein n=1 Tax=Desulfocurvibacter africanus TaxID=873 RepID=UPI000412646A|nr:hypothetical protein [Desulfocurvibacter africanus]
MSTKPFFRLKLERLWNGLHNRLFYEPKTLFAVEQYYRSFGQGSLKDCAKYAGITPLNCYLAKKYLSVNSNLNYKSNSVGQKRPCKNKVYFRTIFYAPHEIPFIKMNLFECYPYVDKFIIVECNRTQVGEPREFIFPSLIKEIPQQFHSKIVYIPADVSHQTVNCAKTNDGKQMHANEDIMWDWFTQEISLEDNDIIIAADADEIIYSHIYPYILRRLRKDDALLLPLHQFFYRMNYLWTELTFWAPQAARASYYKKRPKPHRWRYEGRRFPFIAGCHFSWQLTIDEMIMKLNTYAHKDIYGKFANREILEVAVRDKTYPFEPNEQFTIRELDPDNHADRCYYPQSFYSFREDFAHLLPNARR